MTVIYVSDMGKARSWRDLDKNGWVDAHKAFFVIDSDASGGMGVPEEVPFSDKAAADAFARAHGGRVVAFADIPKDGILGSPVGAGMPRKETSP